MVDVNEVVKRYFSYRKENSHKVSLGKIKNDFNLPLHYIMGFTDLNESYDNWLKAKTFIIEVNDEHTKFTDFCMEKAVKDICLNPKKIIDGKTQEIIGETVKYSASYSEGKLFIKCLVPVEYNLKKTQIDFIYEPYYETAVHEGKATTIFNDIQIFGIQIDLI